MSDSGSGAGRFLTGRAVFLTTTVLLCAISLYLCHRAIRVMERAVTVMESVDRKMDRAIAAAPVARGLLDAAGGDQLQEAAKAKAAAVEQRAKEWLDGKLQRPEGE